MSDTTKVGQYCLRLERPCWVNNVSGRVRYRNRLKGKRENGTYFLGVSTVRVIQNLTPRERMMVRIFMINLMDARR